MSEQPDAGPPGSALTPMQTRVVRLCSLGCTVKEAARVLGLSHHTVENHKIAAMKRIGATNVAMLTRYAMTVGISPIGDTLNDAEQALLDSPEDPPADE